MRTSVWALQAALGAALIVGLSGCHSKSVNAQSGYDPAAANMAPNEAQQQAEQYANGQSQYGYGQQAPIERTYPGAGQAPPGYYDNGQQPYADQGYGDDYEPVDYDSLTDEEATEPPPPLPDYDQPPDPDPDYIWTPGYWAWGPYGYYWVPGAWVYPPYVGALWTPGYWGYVGGVYRFHHGYWGRHVGFYGGINYGFGYIGVGYEGGYWNSGHFFYNTAVTRVNVNVVRNVYVHNVVVERGPRVSFNGGRGGLQVRPRPAEIAAIHEQRYAPMQSQIQVRDQAAQNRQQFYSANHGRPAEIVAARPIMSDRRMPAELPRAAAMRGGEHGQMNRGDRQPGRYDAPGQQGRPDFRNGMRQGGQDVPRGGGAPEIQRPGQQQGRPDFPQRNQEARPVQPQNDARPPQQQPFPNGRPQVDGRGQYQGRPQQQPQQPQQPVPQQRAPEQQQQQNVPQQRPDFRGQQGRPDFQQRNGGGRPDSQQQRQQQEQLRQQPQAQPQPTSPQQRPDFRGQGRPDFQQRQEMRQQPQPQQATPQPQAQPQMQRQGPPPQAERQGPPPQRQGGDQPRDNGHGRGGGEGRDRH